MSFATLTPPSNMLFIGFKISLSKLFSKSVPREPISSHIFLRLFKESIEGFWPLAICPLISFTVLIALSIFEFIFSNLFITFVNECKLDSSSSFLTKSSRVWFKDFVLDSLLLILSSILFASSLPLLTAFTKSDVRVEADDDISTIKFRSDLISGAILFTLLLVSCKNPLISLERFLVSLIVFFIVGKSFFTPFTVSFNLDVALDAVFIVLSMLENFPCRSLSEFSTFDNLGSSFSNPTPISFENPNIISLTVLTTVWLTWSWIVEAPFSVIFGAIALIFSFTV